MKKRDRILGRGNRDWKGHWCFMGPVKFDIVIEYRVHERVWEGLRLEWKLKPHYEEP